jgi:hypothetical protein
VTFLRLLSVRRSTQESRGFFGRDRENSSQGHALRETKDKMESVADEAGGSVYDVRQSGIRGEWLPLWANNLTSDLNMSHRSHRII